MLSFPYRVILTEGKDDGASERGRKLPPELPLHTGEPFFRCPT